MTYQFPQQFLERFVITGELGRGGMGVVLAARDLRLKRPVAIKVLAQLSDEAVARFLREARLTAKLSHPNIVAALDLDVLDRRPCLISELMEGGSLAALLVQRGPLEAPRAVELMAPVLDALATCHAADILHRDLKPANILLTAEGTPKIADLGLARHVLDAQGLTATGSLVGTPAYMPPEQLAGELATTAGDVYAIGVTLYQMLTGDRPFSARTLPELLEALRSRPAPDVRARAPATPEALAHLVAACLAKEPELRPASATLLGERLLASLPRAAGRPAPATRTPPPAAAPRGAHRAHLALLALLAAAAVALLAVPLAVWLRAPRGAGSPSPSATASASLANDARNASLEADIDALWTRAGSWGSRWSRALEVLTQVSADPERTAVLLAGLGRDIDAEAPRLARITAAARALEDGAGASTAGELVLRARASLLAYVIHARRHRIRVLHPIVLRLETTLQTGDAFLLAERAPHPPELVAGLRRMLADFPRALDVVAADPPRHPLAIGELLNELRRVTHWVYLSVPAAVGASGEAALARFEQQLLTRAAQQGGLIHAIAHGIASIERERMRERTAASSIERTLEKLDELARRWPALKDHLHPVVAALAELRDEYRPKTR